MMTYLDTECNEAGVVLLLRKPAREDRAGEWICDDLDEFFFVMPLRNNGL